MLYVIIAPTPKGELFAKANKLIPTRSWASLYSSPSAARVRFPRLFELYPDLPWLAYEPWLDHQGTRVRIYRSELEGS